MSLLEVGFCLCCQTYNVCTALSSCWCLKHGQNSVIENEVLWKILYWERMLMKITTVVFNENKVGYIDFCVRFKIWMSVHMLYVGHIWNTARVPLTRWWWWWWHCVYVLPIVTIVNCANRSYWLRRHQQVLLSWRPVVQSQAALQALYRSAVPQHQRHQVSWYLLLQPCLIRHWQQQRLEQQVLCNQNLRYIVLSLFMQFYKPLTRYIHKTYAYAWHRQNNK